MSTGARAAAVTLRAHNVDTLFTLCGDHTNPLLHEAAEAGIRIIDARDERGAAWMAAGWALATGRPGIVVVSNTPALLNAATALADADASGIPVVCITGGVALKDRGAGHPGDADQAALVAPFVRWSEVVSDADLMPSSIGRAFAAATGPRRGVAVLDLPLDIQRASTAVDVLTPAPRAPRAPDPTGIAEAMEALARAERPVILAGEGCWWSGAGDALTALVERGGIPAFTVRAARGLLSDDHALCLGFPNLLTPVAHLAYAEADVAVIVGARLDITLAHGGFHPGCTAIRIDEDPDAFATGRTAEIAIEADARSALAALSDGIQTSIAPDWVERLRRAKAEHAGAIAARADIETSPVHPGRLMAEIAAVLPPEAIVCVDAGELALWAIDAIPARAPASFHASSFSPLGALGMGLPWAIGMKVAHPTRPVIVIAGDGSFGFTAMEIETSARHDAPVAVIVGNDAGWGIVRHLQEELHGAATASDLPASPYELLADFAGGVGDRVRSPRQLPIAATNAMVTTRASVVNVELDRNAKHPAIDLIASMFRG